MQREEKQRKGGGKSDEELEIAMESKRWRRASDEELVMVGEDAPSGRRTG